MGKATAGGFFLGRYEQNFGSWGDCHFQLVGGWGSSPSRETLIFRLLIFKQTTYITRVITRPERWHIMLFSQSALIPQLCLHFFQKFKYCTLGNKAYSTKLFWVVVAANFNPKKVKGTVSPLVKTRVFINALIWLILDC